MRSGTFKTGAGPGAGCEGFTGATFASAPGVSKTDWSTAGSLGAVRPLQAPACVGTERVSAGIAGFVSTIGKTSASGPSTGSLAGP